MSEQSGPAQRFTHPAEGAVPGEDDMLTAPDEAMASHSGGYGSPQEVDPAGHPHAASDDVPHIRTDAAGEGGVAAGRPGDPAGPGRENAQTEPADDDERRDSGSA